VSEDAFRILQIGLLVEEVETMQDLLRPIVEAYVRQLSEEPEVQAILAEAGRYRDRTKGVTRLPRQTSRTPRRRKTTDER
jgi:hypothetical protein